MKKKKLILIIIIVVILLILCLIGFFIFKKIKNKTNIIENENLVQTMDDETKVNVSPKLAETKQIDGLEISNITLTENSNVTQLLGTITNKTEKAIEESIITIVFVDKDGNEMTSIETYVKKLQPGESTGLNASTTFDYSNAYDIKIKK